MLLASVLAPPFLRTAGVIGFVCSLFLTFVIDRLVADYRKTIHRQNERLSQQVAELERLSAELAERNEEALAYARTVAHDLRNPLAVLLSTCEMLQAGLLEKLEEQSQAMNLGDAGPTRHDREQLELLDRLDKAGHTMTSIIEHLLVLADEPREVTLSAPVDVHASAERVLEQLTTFAEEKGAEIEFGERWPLAEGYGPWIDRVWTNLIYNGLQHGGENPTLKLSAQRRTSGDQAMLRFSVSDNGPGMGAAEQRLLFREQPYSDSSSAVHGLGLWIVRRIVERLGGWVGVESSHGQGSTFWFDLREYQKVEPEGPLASSERL